MYEIPLDYEDAHLFKGNLDILLSKRDLERLNLYP